MTAASADLTELSRDLRRSGDSAAKTAHRVLAEVAGKIQSLAAAKAPRKSGTLANSINVRWEGDLVAVVGPAVAYGAFQEYGTGGRGEFPGDAYEIRPKKASVLKFVVGGRTVYAKVVRHPGVRAKPYMRPAAQEALGSLAEEMAKAGTLSITKGPRA